jgi:DNA-binding NarL/FixJ family response regulator
VIRVLLADDQDLVRVGLRIILESEDGIEVVGEARTGREAVSLARELDPDVVCMDVQMPDLDGLAATRALVADGVRAGVLVLTTFDRDDYLFDALAAGASGFVLKNSTPEELVAAVQVIARGDALLAPDVTRRVIERFSSRPGAAPGTTPAGILIDGAAAPSAVPPEGASAADGAPDLGGAPAPGGASAPEQHPALAQLTEREREVLELLGAGQSNTEIARELYLGEATVKTHVSKILQKLALRDRIQAVVFAYENGIAVPGTTQPAPPQP